MNYTKILIAIFLLFSFALKAQEVNNVRFEQVGKQIHIYYDLQGEGTYNISIYYSEGNGENYGNALIYVTDAVGENQESGINKMIIWDVLEEKEKLSGEIKFKIEAISFSGKSGYFEDKRDGKRYSWVRIGAQIWMAENLNYKISDSWCYDDKQINCDKYGRLYTWKGAKKACPVGWYLPSDNDWKQMEMVLGMSQSEADDRFGRGRSEAKKIKSTSGWDNNGIGTNSSGFNALPGGSRGSSGSFVSIDSCGYWWLSSEYSSPHLNTYAWSRYLNFDDDQVHRDSYNNAFGFSVRCLKD